MEEKSIDELRREAQELYQSKLQAYQQAQKETTTKKETAPKSFLKPNDLKKFFEPVFSKSEKKNKDENQINTQELFQSEPQTYQQNKRETPPAPKKSGITIPGKVLEPSFFQSGLEEKTIDDSRRESQKLYQSKLQAYKQTQQEAATGIFQNPDELTKERVSFLRKKSNSAGNNVTEISTPAGSKPTLEHKRNNLFVISVFLLMVIIVCIKLLLFMP